MRALGNRNPKVAPKSYEPARRTPGLATLQGECPSRALRSSHPRAPFERSLEIGARMHRLAMGDEHMLERQLKHGPHSRQDSRLQPR